MHADSWALKAKKLGFRSRAVFKLWASHQNLVSTEGKDDNIVTQIRNEWTIGVSLS